MKKQYVNSVSILLTMLCLAFTACNGMLTGGDTGTVRVVIGGGTARSVDGKGLPELNESNTVITITDEEGTELARETASVTVTLVIGTKITVKAVVTTAAGEWHGSEKHTVTAGDNFIAIKLSKAPKVAANLLVSITGKHPSGSNIVSLSTQNGKKLLDGILAGSTKPIAARDKIGRIYVLYEDTSPTPTRHLKRFDVEGNEDTSFPTSGLLGAVSSITDIAVDIKTDTLFFVNRMPAGWALYFTNKENAFNLKGPSLIPIPPGYTADTIQAIAAYNGMVYIALTMNASPQLRLLLAYEAVLSGSTLTLTHKATQELSKLRTDSAFDNNRTICTDLFADESGVYCLLAENETRWASESYAVGTLIRYEYSGSTLTKKGETGLNPVASGTDQRIPFDDGYFFHPIGFIGYDEDNIYIADDGFGIQYKNENWHFMNNRNRIAAFNRETGSLSFNDPGATWYDEKPKYPSSTKTLLWGKDENQEFRYWTSEDGTEAFSATNKLFEDSVQPTDVFCYDQDGNLYILWQDSSNYKVRRFALKEDGTYDKAAAVTPDENLDIGGISNPVSAIAVDISDGQNSLYHAYKNGHNGHIQKKSWPLGAPFGSATSITGYDVMFNANNTPVTALAANKDGLFVGTRTMSISPAGYTLSVKQYAKQDGADKGTIAVGAFQPTPTEPGSPYPPYTKIMSAINDLQILDGVLYAVTSKEEYGMKKTSFDYKADTFKNSGKLYKIGSAKDGFSGSAVELAKKDPVGAAGNEVGYGFYRFIAVKYDEAERIRLIIASDGAWGKDGTVIFPDRPYCKNADKVLEYDLKGSLQGEQNSGGSFSKVLQESGFEWN